MDVTIHDIALRTKFLKDYFQIIAFSATRMASNARERKQIRCFWPETEH